MNDNLKIFLDIDGVLTDFVGHAVRKLNLNVDPTNCSWDFFASEMTPRQFWDSISLYGPCFWRNMPTHEWAENLIDVVKSYDPEFTLLTSPANCSYSWSGKRLWIQETFGASFNRQIFTHDKHFCAAPGRVLIDDTEINCKRFADWGGQAILFPQSWNSLGNDVDRVKHVAEGLERLKPDNSSLSNLLEFKNFDKPTQG